MKNTKNKIPIIVQLSMKMIIKEWNVVLWSYRIKNIIEKLPKL